jgi:DNA-binding response OmpR family regulator
VKVLIAEDDARIRRGLCDILRSEGYEPCEASNGAEALARFERERPDFVCLDIMMPGQSGYDVCRELRRRGSSVPIVFISAKSEEIDKVLALELGGDDFIVKPFGVKEVVARIRAVTRRCMAARAWAKCVRDRGSRSAVARAPSPAWLGLDRAFAARGEAARAVRA